MGAAAAPMLIGSAIGGLVNQRNPLQGALLGGALGGIGGSVLGGAQTLAGSKLAAAVPSGGAGMAGAGGSGMFAAGTIPAGAAGSSAYMPAVSAAPIAGNAAMPLGYSTVAAPAMAAPTLMQTVSEIPKAFQSFAGENPVLTQMTLMGAQNALQTPPRPQANPNLMRGSPIAQQAQGQRFQTNVPQVSLI